MTANAVLKHLLDHVHNTEPRYGHWYAGIAADAEARLFIDHAVDRDNHHWAYARTDHHTHARAVEQHLLNLGFDGGPGGGSEETLFVYVFRKTVLTRR